MMEVKEWDGYIEEELFESTKEMMVCCCLEGCAKVFSPLRLLLRRLRLRRGVIG